MNRNREKPGLEFAMASWPDGRACVHSEGQQGAVEFLRALAERPDARPPIGRNGKRQVWSRELGFHDNVRDDLADHLAPHLSPAQRGLHESRKQDERDAGFLRDWRQGRRPGSDPRVLAARQRQAWYSVHLNG